MKIYLAGSISGGRDYADGVFQVNNVLKELGHEILTPFVVDTEINEKRFPGLKGDDRAAAIFEEDLELLEKSDVAMIEVSQISIGVGVEIGYLVGLARLSGEKKPTLFLRHDSLRDTRNSFLVQGNPYGELVYYNSETIDQVVTKFMRNIDFEGRINKERGR